MRLPSFLRSSHAPVTWSACTCVSSVQASLRPSSSTSAASRRACSNTGSISSASRVPASATRYVYVDDWGSKSCRKIMSVVNFTPLTALAGGLAIGAASVWLLAANGRIAGVSGILHGMVWPMSAQSPGERPWRAAFIAGLIVAGFAWHALLPTPEPLSRSLIWVAAAGALVGFGTRLGGGCTSGHGVCGLGRLSMRSLVAVMVFMLCGMAATFVMRHVL